MILDKRIASQHNILEGLSHIDETTLPNEVINNMGPKVKAFFTTDRGLDLNKMVAVKVNSIKDEAYKTAKYRFYVMNDEYKKTHNGEGVLVSWDSSYSWSKNSKYQIWDPQKSSWLSNEENTVRYRFISEYVKSIWVIPHDVDLSDSEIQVKDKQRARRNAKYIEEPFCTSGYEPGTKEYRKGRKNELVRQNRKNNVGVLVKELLKKYGNLSEEDYSIQDYRYGDDLVQIFFYTHKVFHNLYEARFNINKDKVLGVRCVPRPIDKNNTNIEYVISYGEGIAADAGDFLRLMRKIKEDKDLKILLSQI